MAVFISAWLKQSYVVRLIMYSVAADMSARNIWHIPSFFFFLLWLAFKYVFKRVLFDKTFHSGEYQSNSFGGSLHTSRVTDRGIQSLYFLTDTGEVTKVPHLSELKELGLYFWSVGILMWNWRWTEFVNGPNHCYTVF